MTVTTVHYDTQMTSYSQCVLFYQQLKMKNIRMGIIEILFLINNRQMYFRFFFLVKNANFLHCTFASGVSDALRVIFSLCLSAAFKAKCKKFIKSQSIALIFETSCTDYPEDKRHFEQLKCVLRNQDTTSFRLISYCVINCITAS